MSATSLARSRTTPARALRIQAPAKINLTLRILGRRSDGYHDLESLVVGVDLRDDVSLEPIEDPGLIVSCGDASLAGSWNLAARAVTALARHTGETLAHRLSIEKRIPLGAGLGGGSADAAAALRLGNELWQTDLSDSQLAEIGSEIGSDVPLFFSLPSVVLEGRGERTRPAALSWSGWVLLVYPGFQTSAAEAYAAWSPADSTKSPAAKGDEWRRARSAEELTALLENQLEPAVYRVYPRLRDVEAALSRAGLSPVRITGSGSTFYRLFDEEKAARRAAQRVQERCDGFRTYVAAAPAGWNRLVREES